MDEVKKEEIAVNGDDKGEEKEYYPTYTLFLPYISLLVVFMGICTCLYYFGIWDWDVSEHDGRPVETQYMLGMCFGILGTCITTIYYLGDKHGTLYHKLPNFWRILFKLVFYGLFIAFFIIMLAVVDTDENELWKDIAILGFGFAFIVVWLWFWYCTDKGKKILEKYQKKTDCNAHKCAVERAVRESRTDMGLVNPGYNERTYDKYTMRVHIRKTVLGFTGLLMILCILMLAGHFDTDADARVGCAFCGMLICIVLYMLFVHSEINGAVCKGALDYNTGVKYDLFGMFWLSLTMFIVYSLIPGVNGAGEPNAFSQYWDVWDYVSSAIVFGAIMLITFLACSINGKRDGRFALFSIDSYNKQVAESENALKEDDNDKGERE